MVTRRTDIQISTTGGPGTTQDFNRIGASGEAAFLRVKTGARGANVELARLDRTTRTAAQGFGVFGQAGSQMGQGLRGITRNIGVLTAGVATATLVFGGIIRTIGGFQEAIAEVAAVSRATVKEVESLSLAAQRMGVETFASASQAAQGMAFLGRAGFEVTQIITALPAVLNLAGSSMLSMGEAADISSNILTSFALEASELIDVVDILASVSSSTNTNVLQLGEAFSKVGTIAATAKQEVGETAVVLGLMGNAGIQASVAGTGLRRILGNLLNPTAAVTERLAELGLTIEDLSPLTHDYVQIVETLARANLSAGDALEIFGQRGGPAILALTRQLPLLKELTAGLDDVAGTAQRMTDIMQDTIPGAARRLGGAIQGLTIQFASDSGFNFALRETLDLFTRFIRFIVPVQAAVGTLSEQIARQVKIILEAQKTPFGEVGAVGARKLLAILQEQKVEADRKLAIEKATLDTIKAEIIEAQRLADEQRETREEAEKYQEIIQDLALGDLEDIGKAWANLAEDTQEGIDAAEAYKESLFELRAEEQGLDDLGDAWANLAGDIKEGERAAEDFTRELERTRREGTRTADRLARDMRRAAEDSARAYEDFADDVQRTLASLFQSIPDLLADPLATAQRLLSNFAAQVAATALAARVTPFVTSFASSVFGTPQAPGATGAIGTAGNSFSLLARSSGGLQAGGLLNNTLFVIPGSTTTGGAVLVPGSAVGGGFAGGPAAGTAATGTTPGTTTTGSGAAGAAAIGISAGLITSGLLAESGVSSGTNTLVSSIVGGAGAGTAILPGIGTVVGAVIGGAVGAIVGIVRSLNSSRLSNAGIFTSANRSGFQDDFSLAGPFGRVGLVEEGTRRTSQSDVEELSTLIRATDQFAAQLLTDAQEAMVTAALQRTGSSPVVGFEELTSVSINFIRQRLTAILREVGGAGAATALENIGLANLSLPAEEQIVALEASFSRAIGVINQINLLTSNIDITPLTQAEIAIEAITAEFAALTIAANNFEIATTGLAEAQTRSIALLTTTFESNIQAQIDAITDPNAFALSELERQFDIVRDEATALGADLLAVEELFLIQRRRLLGEQQDAVNNFVLGLTATAASPLPAQMVLANAEAAFTAAIQSGSGTALVSTGGTLLDLSRNRFGSAPAFFETFNTVLDALTDFQDIPGFAHGGQLRMGGSGGPDSQLLMARVSPGERVSFHAQDDDLMLLRAIGGATEDSTNVLRALLREQQLMRDEMRTLRQQLARAELGGAGGRRQ